MAVGDTKISLSPIVRAIAEAEQNTTGEIRVHLSKRRWDLDPFKSGQKIFKRYRMSRTAERNAVLLYINLRKRKFAIIGDEGVHQKLGQKYWEALAMELKNDLLSTHFERAIAVAVRTIGVSLAKFFPRPLDASNPNELSDEVTLD